MNLSTRVNVILTGKGKNRNLNYNSTSVSAFTRFMLQDSTRYGVTKEKLYDNNREAISFWLGKCVYWNKLYQLTTGKYVTTMKSCFLLQYLVDPSQAWDLRMMNYTSKFNWTVCWVMSIKSLKLAKLSQRNFQNTINFQIIWHSKFRYTLFYEQDIV